MMRHAAVAKAQLGGRQANKGNGAGAGGRGHPGVGGRKMRNTCDSATTTDLDDDNTQHTQYHTAD